MKKLIKIVLAAAIISFVGVFASQNSYALSGSDFNAGNIIDDAVFYNENALDANQIQSFLNSKVPTCDTNGSRPAAEYGRSDISRAQYAAQRGWHSPPYVCMRDYKQDTPSMGAASGLCNAIGGGSQRSAAQIISDVSKACHISPQVLLVLLQKEQSLVTDTWPLNSQYRNATGFACPDTAPCNPAYNGFFYQVYHAARQFQVYKAYPNSYNYVAGRVNNIYYNPDLSRCGSSPVYIQNQATAALYIYTPYQPNASALNNLYGTGDSCGAYGNRNFWRLFSEWFGTTKMSTVPLDDQRWMQVKTGTYKTSLVSGQQFGPLLETGRQIYFVDKTYTYGKWYLRTQFDHQNGSKDGIPLDSLEEVPITPITTKWMSTKQDVKKVDPIRNLTFENVSSMTAVKAVDKVTLNGTEYYRTQYEKDQNRSRFIPVSSLENLTFYNFAQPRTMMTNKATKKIDITTGAVIQDITPNSFFFFDRRITIDSVIYAQMKSDHGTTYAININDLSDLDRITFSALDQPRWMKLARDTKKVSLLNGNAIDPLLIANRQIYFPDKAFINGEWYLRSQYDKDNGSFDAIRLSDLTEI